MTFLFSDVEGSTRLWADHGREMASALARHDEILREASDAHGGYVFATAGDSFGIAFDRPAAAVDFASDAQRRIMDEPWPEPVRLRVRMGLHTGEAEERGGDYFGSAVNLAARIEAAGHGGQVLVSAVTAGLLARSDLVELGSYRLKDVVAAQRVFQLGDGQFPPLRSAGSAYGNLPRQPGRLIGRGDALVRLEAAMVGSPLTTLIGPGGIGKTRLALEAARRAQTDQVDGVWLVELAPLGDPITVPRAVADVLGVTEAAGRSITETITSFLETKRCLLVLDNCEHVVDASASLASAVLNGCPQVRILATSREGLALDGELLVAVAPLDEATAAVELFAERAGAAEPTFDLDANRSAVEEVCRRLDGVPLAIELAAARIRTLSPTDLAARLDDRFRLLTAGRRAVVERHRTLRATVEWSHDLLESDEQLLFSRLAVFAGWFDLAATEAVAPDDRLDSLDVHELLATLVNQSMVLSESGPFGRRFRLLETMRQFGAELLFDSGETDRVAQRHAEWCAAYVYRIGQLLIGHDEAEGVARVDEAWENIRAAVGWACASRDAELAASLVLPLWMEHYWRGRIELGDWAEQILDIPDLPRDPIGNMMIEIATGRYRWTADPAGFDALLECYGDSDEVGVALNRAYLHRSWETILELGPAVDERLPTLAGGAIPNTSLEYFARCLQLGWTSAYLYLGRSDEYMAIAASATETADRDGPPTLAALARVALAVVAGLQGERDREAQILEEVAAIELPPRTYTLLPVFEAVQLFEAGNRREAFAKLGEAIKEHLEAENMWSTNVICRRLLGLLARADHSVPVARLLGFYNAEGRSYSAWQTDLAQEARTFLAARMNADLEAEIARGGIMSDREAMEYMQTICDGLAQ